MNDLLLISFLKVVGWRVFFLLQFNFWQWLFIIVYLRTLICLEYKNGGGGGGEAFHISNHSNYKDSDVVFW